MLTLIVARARNGAIGKGNEIPWHAPEDLRVFQRETTGGALIMGRNTWNSLPRRPLPGRLNCVVSRDTSVAEMVRADPVEAVTACYEAGYTRIYGAGGQRIYAELMPLAERLLITEVDVEVSEPDAVFPDFDPADWREVRNQLVRAGDPACTLREFLRATTA
ncbi:dihydrofolate reductase [uncultured Roseobacter sp.]|uniref:dihydrofolate reductase n=1 Tax=uncultured Roseobacter sp. TaxID=114847 RepID=UPI0026325DEA|nr:dihydrofolate reductase [uncultured Roseobacter sp.]